MGWFWWVFGLFAASTMWWLTFRDPVKSRRPLAASIAVVYTVGLVVALYVTFLR